MEIERPATVRTPVRTDATLFAEIEKLMLPDPAPLVAPSETHAIELDADHVQPAGAATLTDPLFAAAENVYVAGAAS